MQTEVLADRARSYIAALALPAAPRSGPGAAPPDPAAVPALAVGQNLVEFADGAAPGLRPAVADALLLAQLAADKTGAATPEAWYEAHRGVLAEIGFRSAGLTRTAQDLTSTNADLHEAIVPVVVAAFAGAAVPAIVIETLRQLSAASENRPWIQLFERESRQLSARQFQISMVDGDASSQTVTMLGFAMDIGQSGTQALFFRAVRETAAIERIEGRFEADNASLAALAPALADKLASRRHAYLAALEI